MSARQHALVLLSAILIGGICGYIGDIAMSAYINSRVNCVDVRGNSTQPAKCIKVNGEQ